MEGVELVVVPVVGGWKVTDRQYGLCCFYSGTKADCETYAAALAEADAYYRFEF